MTYLEARKAKSLIKLSAEMINGDSIMEMKFKAFCEMKENLKNALLLLDEPIESFTPPTQTADSLIYFFDTNYPDWKTLSATGKKSRRKKSCAPRQVLQYLLHTRSRMSLNEIAEITGIAHHATVISSRRVVANMLRVNDDQYTNIYNHALSELNK